MLSLADHQRWFLAALNEGPAHLKPGQFTGSPRRVMLAMRAHANCISHARLTSMEATFPRLRDRLGAGAFLDLARRWTDTAAARRLDSNSIGDGFADWLERQDMHRNHAPLARVEWAWLDAWGAGDAAPLTMAQLAGLKPDALLALHLAWHPATRLVSIRKTVLESFPELAETADAAAVTALAIVRPALEVRLVPMDDCGAAMLATLRRPQQIGNLWQRLGEQWNDDIIQTALVQLISAGALVLTGEGRP